MRETHNGGKDIFLTSRIIIYHTGKLEQIGFSKQYATGCAENVIQKIR